MNESTLDDARSTDPVERLLEDSWQARSRLASCRELLVEATAALMFLGCAVPLAIASLGSHQVDPSVAVMLVILYALVSQVIQFPIGAGYVVPSYLVLVPMLVLLPPGLVPLLVAASLLLGTLGQVAITRDKPGRLLSSVPDAWHALGPALVLLLAVNVPAQRLPLVYVAAFVAGCLLDLMSAATREVAIRGVRPQVQLQVIAAVWLVDACLAPMGVLIAIAARHTPAAILLSLPLNLVLLLLSRDRNTRIAQAQRRLDLVGRERTRLQTAVRRLGEAFAARLDLAALTDIVLRGSIEAVDADAGLLTLSGALEPRVLEIDSTGQMAPALKAASEQARANRAPCQLERDGVWALALPFGFSSDAGEARGALALARRERAFQGDEQTVVDGLVERARQAASDIVAHQLLREQARTDSLTKLGNRRKLAADVEEWLAAASAAQPLVLVMFDLDGFKSYNDTFGHVAGDAMLARLGEKLAAAVSDHGAAYRLGGDEFCVLLAAQPAELSTVLRACSGALEERGENFAVGASSGAVLLPHEARDLEYAIQLADERMYSRKKARGRHSPGDDPTREVLLRILQTKQPSLQDHSSEVATLCLRVGRRLAMSPRSSTYSSAPRSCTTSARSASPTRSCTSPAHSTKPSGSSCASTPCSGSASSMQRPRCGRSR